MARDLDERRATAARRFAPMFVRHPYLVTTALLTIIWLPIGLLGLAVSATSPSWTRSSPSDGPWLFPEVLLATYVVGIVLCLIGVWRVRRRLPRNTVARP